MLVTGTIFISAGLLLAALWLRGDARHHLRRCPRCMYDRRYTTSLDCPECGHKVPAEASLYFRRRRVPLLLFSMILSAAGGWIASFASAAIAESRCVARLKDIDPNLFVTTYAIGPHWLRRILPESWAGSFERVESLRSYVLGDEAAPTIASLSDLKWLSLGSPQVTDAGCRHLSRLQRLESLTLTGATISDSGLALFAACDSLRDLCLSALPHVTDHGLGQLRALHRLEWIGIVRCPRVDGSCLRELFTLPLLSEVVYNEGVLKPGSLQTISRCASLKAIDLKQTTVTDEELRSLAGAAALEWVSVRSTKITAAGLTHLLGIPTLKTVDLWDTPAVIGLTPIQRKRPDVEFRTSDL